MVQVAGQMDFVEPGLAHQRLLRIIVENLRVRDLQRNVTLRKVIPGLEDPATGTTADFTANLVTLFKPGGQGII